MNWKIELTTEEAEFIIDSLICSEAPEEVISSVIKKLGSPSYIVPSNKIQ